MSSGGAGAGRSSTTGQIPKGHNRRECLALSRKHSPLHRRLPLASRAVLLPGARGHSDCYVTVRLREEGNWEEEGLR